MAFTHSALRWAIFASFSALFRSQLGPRSAGPAGGCWRFLGPAEPEAEEDAMLEDFCFLICLFLMFYVSSSGLVCESCAVGRGCVGFMWVVFCSHRCSHIKIHNPSEKPRSSEAASVIRSFTTPPHCALAILSSFFLSAAAAVFAVAKTNSAALKKMDKMAKAH